VIRLRLIVPALLLLMAASSGVRADHSMVLIANARGPVESLSPLDLRKLYLGFVVTTNDRNPIKPVLNASDAFLTELFLQDVMGMSERSYDRRLLTLTLQSGRPRPEVLDDIGAIVEAVANDPYAVAFVWEEDIVDVDSVRIVRVLWHR
jgi:hypothetical protein